MPLKQSTQVAAGAPVPSMREGGEPYAITGTYTVKTGDASGDVVEFGGIPANATVLDLIIHHTGFATTVDAGILSGDYAQKSDARTCGAEFGAAIATATAGIARLATSTTGIALSTEEKGWGIKFNAAPTVGRVIRATLLVVPQGV